MSTFVNRKWKQLKLFFHLGWLQKWKIVTSAFISFHELEACLSFILIFFLYIVYIIFLEVVVVCSNIIVIGGIQGEFFDIVLLLYKIIFFFIIYNIIIWQMLTIQYLLHKIIFSWSFCVNKCVSCFTMQSHIHTKVYKYILRLTVALKWQKSATFVKIFQFFLFLWKSIFDFSPSF